MTVFVRDTEQISLSVFLVEARRRAPQGVPRSVEAELSDPLAAILTRIRIAPETMEHRVLARLLQSMVTESAEGTFRKAEIAAFGPAVLQLLSAFIDDLTGGRYKRSSIRSQLIDHKLSTPPGT